MRAQRSILARRAILPVERFIHSETTGGIMLLIATFAAIAWANSPWHGSYFALWDRVITIDVGGFAISKNLHHWVNDGLMSVFFFVVGLEIKRELVHGELSQFRKALLPVIAAAGGMAIPALIYFSYNRSGGAAQGWGIPMATDIAFALGAIALLGKRIPANLRIFLLTLAAVDDIGAILVIAFFYTESLSSVAIGVSIAMFCLLVLMRFVGVRNPIAFVFAGLLLWTAVLKSGVHATVAGVVLGLLTPAEPWFDKRELAAQIEAMVGRLRNAVQKPHDDEANVVLGELEELTRGSESAVERAERMVHPWVTYLVLPVFALANAGVQIRASQVLNAVSHPVAAGVFTGLVAGKIVGIVGFCWIFTRLRVTTLPTGVRWAHIVGVGMVAGIGFTVSLFITGLAFSDAQYIVMAKIGIMAASIVAGILGYLFLRLTAPSHIAT